MLSAAYGGDISMMDAYVGAVAEEIGNGTGVLVGPLLKARVTAYIVV